MRSGAWRSDVGSSDLAARAVRIDGHLDGPIHVCRDWAVRLYDTDYQVRVDADHVEVDGKGVVVDAAWQPGQRLVMAVIDGRPIAMQVERNRGGWVLPTRGASHRIRVLHPRTAELAARKSVV